MSSNIDELKRCRDRLRLGESDGNRRDVSCVRLVMESGRVGWVFLIEPQTSKHAEELLTKLKIDLEAPPEEIGFAVTFQVSDPNHGQPNRELDSRLGRFAFRTNKDFPAVGAAILSWDDSPETP